jgi:hypothetical protein
VHRRDARVLELPPDLRFLDEAIHEVGPLYVGLEEHLDRHLAAEVHVAAVEDHAHAAAADLAEEAVAAEPLDALGELTRLERRLGAGPCGPHRVPIGLVQANGAQLAGDLLEGAEDARLLRGRLRLPVRLPQGALEGLLG